MPKAQRKNLTRGRVEYNQEKEDQECGPATKSEDKRLDSMGREKSKEAPTIWGASFGLLGFYGMISVLRELC